VRIILLSPSRNVTHFVKHGVLENFIPEICSPVNEHNKRAIAFPVSLAQVVVCGQIRPLDSNWRQPVVEGHLIYLLILVPQKLWRAPVFLGNCAHTPNDCKQEESENGDVNAQTHGWCAWIDTQLCVPDTRKSGFDGAVKSR
jgi:hypothetical protein